jgi:hypothetical protein
MKIKIDLAAFEALTQEQIEALAEAQKGSKAEEVMRSTTGDSILWDWHIYQLSVCEHTIGAYSPYGLDEVRWTTIEKLAEYNVIAIEP